MPISASVVGLIPVVGEVADGANALIYLAEGDTVNAALSAAAMIPGAGAAATGAKYAKKTGTAVEGAMKGGREAAEHTGKKEAGEAAAGQEAKKANGKDGGKDKRAGMKKHEVKCFKKNDKGGPDEYDRQRADYSKKLTDSYEKQLSKKGITGQAAQEQAARMAADKMSTLAALHNPDMIAGGKDVVTSMGDKGVNSSIGAQWKDRVADLDKAARDIPESERGNTKMNAKLKRCK